MKFFSLICLLIFHFCLEAAPYPIGFAIPETKIISDIPEKDRDFASIIPGVLSTYIYD